MYEFIGEINEVEINITNNKIQIMPLKFLLYFFRRVIKLKSVKAENIAINMCKKIGIL